MNKKVFVFFCLLPTVLLLTVSLAGAQQPGKVARIGFLDASTASGMAVLVEAFRQELTKFGWIEGKNLTIEYQFAEHKIERLPELAAELVRRKVDVIVVTTGPSASAAKGATTILPIVMTNVGDPVREGIVASLARPGGNVTGLASLSPELNTKRLELLKDTLPKLSHVGLLRPPRESKSMALQLKELRAAALALKINLAEFASEAHPKDLDKAFETAKQMQINAIMTVATRNFFAERKRILELANKNRLPAIYFQKEFVDEGGLMSYGADFDDLFRRAAHYVDKILKAAKPGDLPVQQATKFELVINLKTAKQIGLTIPDSVLFRADKVIK